MNYYTDDRIVQMLISLMKAHGVRRVIASPGSMNITVVKSLESDSFFTLYSSVDERSAAYMACGMAAETGEPVALSCTEATASRNYVPGLTEAYYRKLPVLAITSRLYGGLSGHNIPQLIDRSRPMPDIAKRSIQISPIQSVEDEWVCNVALNTAMLELRRDGGGPVHINLATRHSRNFTVQKLPAERVIRRYGLNQKLPELPEVPIAIFVGSHRKWSEKTVSLVERFCEQHNAVVICDHTSNYPGKYSVFPSILLSQELLTVSLKNAALLIDIGSVSGAYMTLTPQQVWRIDPDGEVRDTFRKLCAVFAMEEEDFFQAYTSQEQHAKKLSHYEQWTKEISQLRTKIPELPFSNLWIAQHTISRLPKGSRLHLGILNSLRSWNFFEKSKDILAFSNTGGFGIDGNISSLIGASLAEPERLFFGVVGDLAFFYDFNAIGNRHVGSNIRILLINNGRGTEFRNYNHAAHDFGADADSYIAAAGHYGSQSKELVRHYAGALGFQYYSASSKEEYLKHLDAFLDPENTAHPILFEVFTDSEQESNALKMMRRIEKEKKLEAVTAAKTIVRAAVGQKGIDNIKKVIRAK